MAQTLGTFTGYSARLFESLEQTIAETNSVVNGWVMLATTATGKPLTNKKHEWVEDTPISFSDTLSAGVSAAATTFNVAEGGKFIAGNMILVESEICRVTAIATDALTVARGQQGTSAAAHTASTTVSITGNAQVEGAANFTGTYTAQVDKANYTQITTTPVKLTGTAKSVAGPGGDPLARMKEEARIDHMKKIDLAMKFNQTAATGSASAVRYSTGLDGWIDTEIHAITSTTIGGTTTSTALTKAKWDAMIKTMRDNGGRGWVAYCGLTAWGAVQDMLTASGQTQKPIAQNGNTAAAYGFIWQTVITKWGVVTLVLDENAATGTIYFLESSNPANTGFSIRYLAGREMNWEQGNSTGDFESWYWLSEWMVNLKKESCSGKLTAIASGA